MNYNNLNDNVAETPCIQCKYMMMHNPYMFSKMDLIIAQLSALREEIHELKENL